ncbi:aBC superfamily ATP binding cassette transporter [Mycobacterium xenopi 4042]|uniref:ABC superfamily ATP binding cassette transporter n=1 Tax=Mycobacterium xenopi 4042 TaxID=1299334 RepID=X8AQW1_MYCXE|nr:aBC superfamily ATP binding cassette transporter [Mycobacterium xenopi 4042]
MRGVGHEYSSGTPWAKTALRDVSFAVHQGEGVLIHGGNGSGKSTLAWIMAGLTIPTTGTCLLDGRPTHEQVGAVALSFQAARLQLMRSRVDLEVASAAGFSPHDHDRVIAALGAVGLDASLAKRRIDQLSGARCADSCWPGSWHARPGLDPRRTAGRAGRRHPAWSAAAA